MTTPLPLYVLWIQVVRVILQPSRSRWPQLVRPQGVHQLSLSLPPLRYDDVFEAAIDLSCPKTVKEALGGDHAEKWAEAMDEELESPWKNEVYVEVERPTGKKVIGSKWVLRIKTDAAGKIDKFKARVVAKGFRQIEGVGYDETFAPTVRFESIHSLIAMGVAEGWNFDRVDSLSIC